MLCLALFLGLASAAPLVQERRLIPRSPTQKEPGTPLVLSNNGPSASNDTNPSYWAQFQNESNPQPIRGQTGATFLSGLGNSALDKQNPDELAPPSTDHGSVYSSKWSLGQSHNRLEEGGWARQQNIDQLPAAKQMAGVDMRLEPGAIRELHWHLSEWAYILNGSAIITLVDFDGRNYIDRVQQADNWFFPPGKPHSIQAEEDGVEFLLVFDDGSFNEDDTFLLTDWLAHVPKGALKKSFGFKQNSPAFSDIPAQELYIFDAPASGPISQVAIKSPQGRTPQNYTYHLSESPYTYNDTAGWTKILDSRNFSVSTIALAESMLYPGSLRPFHWHGTSDEWSLFMSGEVRISIFAASSDAATATYQAGDIGYIEQNNGHYIECISQEPCHFLELLRAPEFTEVLLSQWLALIPRELVKDHLRLDNETLKALDNFESASFLIAGDVEQT